jgi:hypothetical protein
MILFSLSLSKKMIQYFIFYYYLKFRKIFYINKFLKSYLIELYALFACEFRSILSKVFFLSRSRNRSH